MNLGSHIGQYRIVRRLGAGGMGAVFLGEHVLLGRRAAIKTLLPALSRNREIAERFFNEARATSAISDPGVVQIYDFGYHVDGTAYIVLELLEGESLYSRLERMGQLSVGESLRIARQLAASLAVAHERGIVHRDLKPDNIYLIRDLEAQCGERTKILDFGICKLQRGDARITGSGVMVGTPVYMSPEQCRGNGDVDHRADIYALGCVLFHMLTGCTPFEHDAPGDFIVSHMREAPPLPSKLVPALPVLVDELLLRCLAKSPAERFQSMRALHAAIENVLVHISAPGVPAEPPRPALALGAGYRSVYDASFGSAVATHDLDVEIDVDDLTPPPKQRPPLLGLALAAAALLLVVGAILATRIDIGGASAVAEPSYRYTESVRQIAPAAPSAAVTDVPVEVAPPFAELIEEPPHVETPERKPKAKSAPKKKKPARTTTEDLYDTR